MTDILMPALSPTMEEGGLARWLVKPGDAVKSGDIIAEIETDKATMEVEAVDEGVVEALLVDAGAQGVKVGAVIARLKGEGEAAAPAAPQPKTPKPAEPAKEAPKAETLPPPEEVKGALPLSPSVRRIAAESDLDVTQVKGSGRDGRLTKGDALAAVAGRGERLAASPWARKLAAENNVDLSVLKGSGPGGRIIGRDVEGAPAAAPQPAATAAAPAVAKAAEGAAPAKVPSLEDMGIPAGSYDLIPLDGMRRTVARRLTEAARDIPHFPLTVDLEIDALLASRVAINALLEKDRVKISVNDMVLKASAMALMRVPEANASYTLDGIAMHHDADVAMAVAIDGGLITPIIRKCQTKGLAQIALEAKDLAARARARKLKPAEFQGGTFSVSNLGMFGIRQFSSIINPPQGAILSVGVGEKRPVVRGDKLEIATLMTVTLTCDHRVVDGAIGARWLQVFKTMIEQPAAMLA